MTEEQVRTYPLVVDGHFWYPLGESYRGNSRDVNSPKFEMQNVIEYVTERQRKFGLGWKRDYVSKPIEDIMKHAEFDERRKVLVPSD